MCVHRNYYDKTKNIIAGQINTGDKKIPRRYTFSAVCGLLAGGTLLVNGLHCQVLDSHSVVSIMGRMEICNYAYALITTTTTTCTDVSIGKLVFKANSDT